MGPSHPLNISIWCLVFLCISQFSLALASNCVSPVNVSFYTLNMNLSILWDPPPDCRNNDSILYTVIRDTDYINQGVPNCINISRTSCSLFPVFPNGEKFNDDNEYFKVQSVHNDGLKVITGESSFKVLNRRDIDISPPVVYNISVSSRDVTVSIHGPETPYMRDGRYIYMGDDILADRLGKKFLLDDAKYGATLYTADPKLLKGKLEFDKLKNGFGVIRFDELRPYTNYTVEMRCQIQYQESDTAYLEFRTETAAPDVGPVISGIEVTRRYCDYRDVDISWKDIEHLQNNGPLTSYIVDFRNREVNETLSVTVPVSNRTAVMTRLYRWHRYDVTVSAANDKGQAEGQRSIIEEDIPLIETYKPTFGNITELPDGGWQLTWEPPEIHNQCIVGYRIVTYIDGTVDEEAVVHGANASSGILNFTRSGRYQIDISPVVNDTAGTEAVTSGMYNVKGNKLRQIILLAAGGLVVVALFALVVIMFRKVFCDLSALPDIARSRTMKIVGSIRADDTVLRKPPEKEIFDSTFISPSLTKSPNDDIDFIDDHRAMSTSRAPLLSFSSSDSETYNHQPTRSEQSRNRYQLTSSGSTDSQSDGQSDGRGGSGGSGSPMKRRPRKNRWRKSSSADGNSPTKQQPLTLYIPTQRTATNIPSPSSSCDSGISASTYTGSSSDYATSSPLSEVDETSEWEDREDTFSVSHGSGSAMFASPYVTVDVAVHVGRVDRSCSSSGANSSGSRAISGAYKRIDSRETAEGYLPMNPADKARKGRHGDPT